MVKKILNVVLRISEYFFYYIGVKFYFYFEVVVNCEYYKNGFKYNVYIQLFILYNIDLKFWQELDGFYV